MYASVKISFFCTVPGIEYAPDEIERVELGRRPSFVSFEKLKEFRSETMALTSI